MRDTIMKYESLVEDGHLVNLGKKKIMGTLFTGANDMNTGLQLTAQKIAECNTVPQQIIPTSPNCQTKKY